MSKLTPADYADIIAMIDVAVKHPQLGGLSLAARAVVLVRMLQEEARANVGERVTNVGISQAAETGRDGRANKTDHTP